MIHDGRLSKPLLLFKKAYLFHSICIDSEAAKVPNGRKKKKEIKKRLSNIVDIQDVDPDVFQEVQLRYLYTGRMSLGTMDKMAVAVLAVADK